MKKKIIKEELISFKITKEIYKELIKYAEKHPDEYRIQLSPSQIARQLMMESLKRIR